MKQTYNVNIEGQQPLPTPQSVKAEFPITDKASENVFAWRGTIEKILRGEDKRLLVITGPCSIDNVEASMDYARRLSRLSAEVSDKIFLVMRAYFEKPRTTVGWKGLIYDPHLDGSFDNIETGIRMARQFLLFLAENGVPAATEMLEPVIPQYIADLVSWAAIGARTTESQTHRQMASGLSMPVGFKNTTDGDIKTAIEAIKAAASKHVFLGVIDDGHMGFFRTRGNKLCHLVLRGGASGPNYGSEHVAFAKELMRKSGVNPAVIIDCSHGNSFKRPELQPVALRDAVRQIAGGETVIKGLMLESYLMGGRQDITPGQTLVPGLSVTDSCLSWEDTETLIREARSTL